MRLTLAFLFSFVAALLSVMPMATSAQAHVLTVTSLAVMGMVQYWMAPAQEKSSGVGLACLSLIQAYTFMNMGSQVMLHLH